jgi:hypothetical protein
MQAKKKIVTPTPDIKFWKVKLASQEGQQVFEGYVRHIPAKDEQEAARKALLFAMRTYRGMLPRLVAIEREFYDRPIQI